ncbi:MAG: dethiobiotin synthase [Bacteroidota bacterium]
MPEDQLKIKPGKAPKGYFVTAISTDSGKTLVSALLCRALDADYWKPVQAGLPRDTETVQHLAALNETRIHRETYLLPTPESPHAAAHRAGMKIEQASFKLPATEKILIVEGAGGLLVPLNPDFFVADLIQQLGLPVILVCNLYLGSINHSLLSIAELKRRNISIKGIVFNGESNTYSESIILQIAEAPCLLRLFPEAVLNESVLEHYASELRSNLAN